MSAAIPSKGDHHIVGSCFTRDEVVSTGNGKTFYCCTANTDPLTVDTDLELIVSCNCKTFKLELVSTGESRCISYILADKRCSVALVE